MSQAQLRYSRDELLQSHSYAAPHIEHNQTLHGGLDASGAYIPPRSSVRQAALQAWTADLQARGGNLFDADASLLTGPQLPTVDQQRYLLRQGITTPFYSSLTITGKIEGRGRLLADMDFPDLQDIIVEDISQMALGHLRNGLLYAHGIDEGGEPDRGIGGHDVMWFVARDLVFEPGSHADVEPPENIARPETGRLIPEINSRYEGYLSLLMNLLIIEFRAEIGFANTQAILRTADLFTDRRAAAERAADIVGRIRLDEEIHVRSLRLYLGELRELTIRTDSGDTLPGATLIDRFWQGLVRWATVEQPFLAAQAQRETIHHHIQQQVSTQPDAERISQHFDELADPQLLRASAG
ncbi:MAG: hypothetical protein AAF993_10850 [Pseudomonadota bacterium]